jgi:hypothetical protein
MLTAVAPPPPTPRRSAVLHHRPGSVTVWIQEPSFPSFLIHLLQHLAGLLCQARLVITSLPWGGGGIIHSFCSRTTDPPGLFLAAVTSQ